jgi:hypothetical protein
MTLFQTNLAGANLDGASFAGSTLAEVDLRGAILDRAVFYRALLLGTNLQGAMNLTSQQLVEADTLYRTRLAPRLKEEIERDHPELLEKPEESLRRRIDPQYLWLLE